MSIDVDALKTMKKRRIIGYSGYTAAESDKYLELKKRYANYSNASLKAILKTNLQSMSGTKDVPVNKVADGEVLGQLPKCSECGGGYLKWDNRSGLSSRITPSTCFMLEKRWAGHLCLC